MDQELLGADKGHAGEETLARRVTRYGFARWVMPAAEILAFYPLAIGQRVALQPLPDGSPVSAWFPIVEGWSETFDGDSWTMTCALSDSELSGVPHLEPPALTVAPTLTGEPYVGALLTCSTGEWTK